MNSACLLHKDRPREDAITHVLEALQGLPADCTWRVSWEQVKSERSTQQNKYLFGVAYALLSEATGYEKDDLHTYLLGKHFGTKLKRLPKTKHNMHGLIEVPVRTTTTDEQGRRSVLGKIAFGEYVEYVQRFAAQHGVVIPDADIEWREHRSAA